LACLDLERRSCLVVGGGAVAHEKARGLLDCGARVTVVAPDVSDEVRALDVELVERAYESGDLHGRFLVVAATDDNELNRRVHAAAEARAQLCNVVDVPELCNFIVPAVHRVDPIAVAVTTGGASPALAKRIRDDVAALITEDYADLARELRALRPWAKRELPTYEQRRAYFDDLVAQELG
jgi:precorrin-2 dehydrogenase/sirohydrochlorin ferrochelatase